MLEDAPEVPVSFLSSPERITVTALVVFFLLALWRGWLVPAWQYNEIVRERDALREASDKLLASYQEREAEERRWRAERERRLGDS